MATSPNCSIIYVNNTNVSTPVSPGGTLNLYAKWTGITYYVKYNANGGTGTMANSTHQYGTASNLRANSFSRGSYYTFQGWSTTPTGTVKYANNASINNLTTTNGQTINLYAVWKINSTFVMAATLHFDDGDYASQVKLWGTYDWISPEIGQKYNKAFLHGKYLGKTFSDTIVTYPNSGPGNEIKIGYSGQEYGSFVYFKLYIFYSEFINGHMFPPAGAHINYKVGLTKRGTLTLGIRSGDGKLIVIEDNLK